MSNDSFQWRRDGLEEAFHLITRPRGRCTGSFRLLIRASRGPQIALTEQAFSEIEEVWNLPGDQALQIICEGTIAQNYDFPTANTPNENIRLCLSLTGNASAAGTLAISYNKAKAETLAILVFHTAFSSDISKVEHELHDLSRQICDGLDDFYGLWGDWVCLPLMFQVNCCQEQERTIESELWQK